MLIQSVCVYCGSSNHVAEHHKNLARAVGATLARSGKRVVYGGGRVGLMGLVADSALAEGGEVIGIIPKHIQTLEIEHTGLTELHIVPDMHTRKRLMEQRSDAFVVLPGGFGTMDETFEILTWRQLGLHNKPMIFVNPQGYWDPLLAMIDQMIGQNFSPERNRTFFSVTQDVKGMMDLLETRSY